MMLALDIPKALAFEGFGKIARLSRDCVITEKLDGTNAQILITDHGDVIAGSRTRYVTPEADNFGFAKWVYAHEAELRNGLGPGRHFGEWWGQGIQRGYGLTEKRFSLFNTGRWHSDFNTFRIGSTQCNEVACCHVVPQLEVGPFDTRVIKSVLIDIELFGSRAAPNFMRPEGIIIYHTAADQLFKKTIEKDEASKTKVNA